ncbi:MAG: Glucosaminyl phosphatidylinositol (GlcN-PI) nositol acylation protein [Peltula sp. TS41687]|nr:MAG: Glucosaminyl phosphatidylinositol (GlcN-PI) nositol acylation protein [Peltula sp. TS41687]
MDLPSEATADMAKTFKELKEDFVANLPGGEISEINYVTAVTPAAVILWSALQSRLSFFTPYTPQAFVVDFLLNCCAILFATTVYAANPILLNILLLTPALLLCLVKPRKKQGGPTKKTKPREPQSNGSIPPSTNPLPKKRFLTVYRGCMLVATCMAILAVDFPIFPRRFAKVETWGSSLMDLGVGSFVFSAGVASARVTTTTTVQQQPQQQQQKKYSRRSRNLVGRLVASAFHAFPLLLLGLFRLMSMKRLDYPEHMTEYGMHWNFFFTLAALLPCAAVFQALFDFVPSYALMSVVVAAAYNHWLENTDLKTFILTAPRVDFLSCNREGIFSFLGYLAIHLAGQSAGTYILPRTPPPKLPSRRSTTTTTTTTTTTSIYAYIKQLYILNSLLAYLLFSSLAWTLLFRISTSSPRLSTVLFGSYSPSISRRLANLSYILWVVSYNTTQLLIFYLIEIFFFPSSSSPSNTTTSSAVAAQRHDKEDEQGVPPILRAFNRNGLVLFMLANLLTGLVNLSINTLDVGDIGALAVLVAYMLGLAGVATYASLRDLEVRM